MADKDPPLGKLVRIKESYRDDDETGDYVESGGLLWFRITAEDAREITNGGSDEWLDNTIPYKSLASGEVRPFYAYEMEEYNEEANDS